MRRIACDTSAGWPVRSRNSSPLVTLRVARYSCRPKRASAVRANPKLHRQTISASPKEGCRSISSKPCKVGERLAIAGHHIATRSGMFEPAAGREFAVRGSRLVRLVISLRYFASLFHFEISRIKGDIVQDLIEHHTPQYGGR